MTQVEMFDVCAGKHQGNHESKAANLRARPNKKAAQQAVYMALRIYGPMNCKEIAQKLGREMHQISGRITELKALSKIEATNEVRDGGRVVRARKAN